MLKKIALAGIFFVVSAISLSNATAVTTSQSPSSKPVTSPMPRGFCPAGHSLLARVVR